jgi:colicin import membrane protein
MLRRHENPVALKAGALSLMVHGLLLGLLLISFNWKVVQPASIATVELWAELPSKPVEVQPLPRPEPPKPEPKPLPEPEPKPVPKPEPKADIEVKKEPPKPKEPPKKPEEKPKKPEKKPQPKPQPQDDALKKLQQALLEDQPNLESSPAPVGPSAPSAAQQAEVDKYSALIESIIRPKINNQLCGTGKPVLEYQIILMPTGDLMGEPKLLSSSGIGACDEAVYRAIKLSSPLPKPPPSILQGSRELNLKFRPNDG